MQTQLTIEIENLAPKNGTPLAPAWFGFHNGSFDTYDRGRPVSTGVERIAEDADPSVLINEFTQSGFGTAQGVVTGPSGVIGIGEIGTATITVDSSNPNSRYFNYAAMILPSNDLFIANGNEKEHQIFDARGNFIGGDFIVRGSQIIDAGTEVNDEIPINTAFLGQETPNTGVSENGVAKLAIGFIPGGNILNTPEYTNADFTATNYKVARFRIFNTINGDSTNDKLKGTDKDDWINGKAGDDKLFGGRGNDKLFGGLGNDFLNGGEGDDYLYGNEGNNVLLGGNGADRLFGGAGINTLTGGAGKDVFVLASGTGVDTITDFRLGSGDRLSLSAGLNFNDLTISRAGRNTLISFGADELAVLENVRAGSINESAFVFI
jgi:Ca2+-binding RTX toxin-like protein